MRSMSGQSAAAAGAPFDDRRPRGRRSRLAAQVERLGIDHQPRAARIQLEDDAPDGRHEHFATGTAADDVDLGLACTEDVVDRAELLAR